MKKIIFLIIVMTLIISTNFAQNKNKITIDEYSNYLKEAPLKYLKKIDTGYHVKENISKKEIDEIKDNLFLSKRIGFPSLTKMFANETKDIQNKYGTSRTQYNEQFNLTQKHIENELMKILKKNIPSLEYKLLDNYIIIKGKILKSSSAYESCDETNFKLHFNYFETEVEEIIIGDNSIKHGDVINIYYASEWCDNEPLYCNELIDTDSFIFRLRDNGLSINSKYKYALYTHCFPVKNTFVYDKNEYFENGKIIEWKKLEKILENTINDIRIGGLNEN